MANANGYTITALRRWSVADVETLPSIEKIKAIHIYDFDNTLFNSPLPNAKLWNGHTIGFLQTQDTFTSGGWWHDPRILSATGEGLEKEEAKGWEGWWNEQIVQLIMLSMAQKDALTVLLTGRSEGGFSELLKRMVKSKGMEFDMVVLKPKAGPNGQRFSSTMNFKQAFLESLMETYTKAEELRLYEDRIKHVKGFREFFMDYNKRQNGVGGHKPTRGPITAEVVQVADGATLLNTVIEIAEVQKMINEHNVAIDNKTAPKNSRRLMIKKTVFYTGYLITSEDTQKLLTLANLPPNMPESEMKFLANNVLITPRPAPNSILEKVGGMGNTLLWEVTGTACFENKIWAASVRPVPPTAQYYSENPVPIVVLALRKGARPIDAGKIQNWQPVPEDKAYRFLSTVGEKVLLRVEEDDPKEDEYESLFPNKSKRKHQQDDDSSRQQGASQGQSNRNNQNNNRGGRGGRGGFRGNDNFRGKGNNRGGRGGRARGYNSYRSLDDVPQQSSTNQGYNASAYDDFSSAGQQSNGHQKGYLSQGQQQTPNQANGPPYQQSHPAPQNHQNQQPTGQQSAYGANQQQQPGYQNHGAFNSQGNGGQLFY